MATTEAQREYMRQWRERNRERVKTYKRQYRAANRKTHSEYNRAYYEANSETRRAYNREHYRANLDLHRDKKQRRRARRRNAYVEPVSRMAIFERDNWLCQLCAEPVDPGAVSPDPLSASIDHIVPLAGGGTHEPSNVQCAHLVCNKRKGSKSSC